MNSEKKCDLLFVGNISFDKIKNNRNVSRCVIGGSAYICAYCANFVSDLSVKICSVIGRDFPLHIIQKKGINIDGICISKELSNIFIVNEKDRTIVFEDHPLKFTLQNIEHTQHVHISCRKGIISPYKCLANIRYHSFSIDVMYSSLEENMPEIVKCMKLVDMLFLNNYEYAILNRCLGDKIENVFPRILIFITQGEKGIIIKKELNSVYLSGIKIRDKEKIVSTTGAGDAFIGGFLGSYCYSASFIESLAIGVSVARLAVQEFGVSHIAKKKLNLENYFKELLPIYKIQQYEIQNLLGET
ncbi:PfkB family carbohydrate kinase [Patescibacteria group bacterium]